MFGSRRGLAALLAGGVLICTAACSGGHPSAGATRTAAPSGPTALTFAVYGPPQVITAYARIAADFSALHPDIVVNIKPYDSHAAARAALDQEIAAHKAPDAFLVSLDDVPGLVTNGSVRRLDQLLGERHVDFGDAFSRSALEAFSSANALQCMPVDVSPLVVYFNTDLIDLARLTPAGSPPINADTGWTLADFAAAAREASGPTTRGVYVAPDIEQVSPFIWAGGGQVVDDDTAPKSLTLSDPQSASGLEQLLEIVRNPALTFDQKQIARSSALSRFETGKLGMILGFRDLVPTLRAQANLNFDVMPLPKLSTKATVGHSSGLCLSSASRRPEKTADFLAYAVSDDAARLLADTGYTVPTNLDVVNSDDFLQPDREPFNAGVFGAAVRSIRSFPTTSTWPSVVGIADPFLTQLFYAPVIDPLGDRLTAIDASSVPLLAPASPTASPTSSPGGN